MQGKTSIIDYFSTHFQDKTKPLRLFLIQKDGENIFRIFEKLSKNRQ
jgi:hypothetical protein